LYVAEFDADRVSQIDTHGIVTPFASVPNPFGLAFRGEDLFVSSDTETGEIWRVDETGSAFLFAYGPSHVGGITVAPDEAIVATFSGPNAIYRFAEETAAPALTLTSPGLLRAEPGTTVTHTFRLGNVGNGQDGAWLTATSEHGWTVTVPGGGFLAPLTCGEERWIDVAVTVPTGIPLGTEDVLTLTTTSRLDPTVNERAHSVTIYGLPDASFTSSSPDWLGQTTVFTNTTTGPISTTYAWSFGDTVTTTTPSPTHTFTAPGAYPVTLTATSIAGSDVTSETVIVKSPPPWTSAAAPRAGWFL
jgi:plastocyanin